MYPGTCQMLMAPCYLLRAVVPWTTQGLRLEPLGSTECQQ